MSDNRNIRRSTRNRHLSASSASSVGSTGSTNSPSNDKEIKKQKAKKHKNKKAVKSPQEDNVDAQRKIGNFFKTMDKINIQKSGNLNPKSLNSQSTGTNSQEDYNKTVIPTTTNQSTTANVPPIDGASGTMDDTIHGTAQAELRANPSAVNATTETIQQSKQTADTIKSAESTSKSNLALDVMQTNEEWSETDEETTGAMAISNIMYKRNRQPTRGRYSLESGTVSSLHTYVPTLPMAGMMSTDEVYKMFQEVNKSLREIKSDVTELKDNKSKMETDLGGIEFDVKQIQDDMVEQDKRLKESQDEIRFLNGVIVRYEEKFHEITKKISNMEKRQMKDNIIISGLEEKKDEDCKQVCIDFVKNDLRINEAITIDKAHRMGAPQDGIHRQMIMKLANVEDKGKIFQNASNLKGTRKYVNDQLPDKLEEDNRKLRKIVAANKKLPKQHQQDMKIKQGKLYLGGSKKPHLFKVKCPAIKDIIEMTTDERVQLEEIPLYSTSVHKEMMSSFQAYGGAATTMEQVRRYYSHLKIKHSDATHIVMAYRLPGLNKADDEGYDDDGEHGSGRRILKMLQDDDKKKIAIYVVRHYGGVNLKKRRFEIYNMLAGEICESIAHGRGAVSKLNSNQAKLIARTVRPRSPRYRGLGSNVRGGRNSTQTSPHTTHTQSTFRRYMQEELHNGNLRDMVFGQADNGHSDTNTCPTSATSGQSTDNDGEGTLTDDYHSPEGDDDTTRVKQIGHNNP